MGSSIHKRVILQPQVNKYNLTKDMATKAMEAIYDYCGRVYGATALVLGLAAGFFGNENPKLLPGTIKDAVYPPGFAYAVAVTINYANANGLAYKRRDIESYIKHYMSDKNSEMKKHVQACEEARLANRPAPRMKPQLSKLVDSAWLQYCAHCT